MSIDRDDLQATLAAWRRQLHAMPELGFAEHRTADFVAERLESFGLEIQRGIGGTGVVGTLRAGGGNRAIGFRADIDALAIEEVAGRPHGSAHAGCMHACGHDGHTTMLLGAAMVLAARPGFAGTVHFVFQPAEEHGRGALRMIEDGLLQRFPCEEIYGLHNMPGLPAGSFATRPGAYWAAEDNFEITVTGRGGHAATPHKTVDPLIPACAIVLALQTIVARQLDPAAPAVVSVTEFLTDGIRNVIPTKVTIRGDCRSFDPAVSTAIETGMRRIAEQMAAAHGATATLHYTREFVPLHNAAAPTEAALRAAAQAFGSVDGDAVPIMASEDFAQFLAHVPGNFSVIGNGAAGTAGAVPLHNPAYDFNDELLLRGVDYFVALAADRLPPGNPTR